MPARTVAGIDVIIEMNASKVVASGRSTCSGSSACSCLLFACGCSAAVKFATYDLHLALPLGDASLVARILKSKQQADRDRVGRQGLDLAAQDLPWRDLDR